MNLKYKALLEETDRCELCGSNRNLEVHHIVPKTVESYGVDLDDRENLILVCRKCHALLTPRGILIKIGQKKKQHQFDQSVKFYERLDEKFEEYGGTNPDSIMDIFLETHSEIYEQGMWKGEKE